MAKMLLGTEVNKAIVAELQARIRALRSQGITPTLAILRVGENARDLSYERGATAKAELVGVNIKRFVLPEDADKAQILAVIDQLNADESIHGVLLFRPLPYHLKDDESEICNRLKPEKDVDAMTHLSNAGVFENRGELGFTPCTAAACMEILDHYNIDCTGKNAVVIGRSAVVGKPVAMLLLHRNATVTVCHTKTKGLAEICRNADIIISAAGRLGSLTRDFVSPDQVIIDVSMNWNPEKITPKGKGGMSGDAVFEEVEPIVAAITPVPGGVGAVTTTVLMKHVVEAAETI
ncbi:MAG: bifunctional 5,10-methylenetetrahydrofolate dehydrogenase/5,10-methenyltetrahydrofolate cyclohydrolase [Oscillospiraceae bacterium]|nr:bifunctional 5,10-methylenetetrahydrofolate dehydrogenase/5,10-methenyltetrahydrofolate cyclohydrolase [Oscillospiraceae bacterium]